MLMQTILYFISSFHNESKIQELCIVHKSLIMIFVIETGSKIKMSISYLRPVNFSITKPVKIIKKPTKAKIRIHDFLIQWLLKHRQ